MAPTPLKIANLIAAEIKATRAKLKAKLARDEARLAKLDQEQLRQAAAFVKKVGAADLDPEVLMGLLLKGVEDVKNPAVEEECRRRGAAHFRRSSRRQPRVVETDDAGAGAPPLPGAA